MRRLAVLLVVLLAIAGCRPPESDTSGSATTSSGATISLELDGEPVIGRVPAVVTVSDGNGGGPIEGARVRIQGDMNHAGMEPVIRDAVEIQPGRYVAEDFEFTMGGDWIVSARVTLPGGESAEASAFYDVGR